MPKQCGYKRRARTWPPHPLIPSKLVLTKVKNFVNLSQSPLSLSPSRTPLWWFASSWRRDKLLAMAPQCLTQWLAWSGGPSMSTNASAQLPNHSEFISYFFLTCLPYFYHDGLLKPECTGYTPAHGLLNWLFHWLFLAPGMLFPDSPIGDSFHISPLSQVAPTLIHTLTPCHLLASPQALISF